MDTRPAGAVPLSALVDRWVADHVITPEQALRMTRGADIDVTVGSAAPPAPGRRSSLVVEALGYLGGAIVVAATMLIAAQYWGDLTTAWRVGVMGATTLALLVGGAAAPASMAAAGDRLRSVLWLASTAAFAGSVAVLGYDALDLDGANLMLVVATGTTAYALGLWLRCPMPAQQIAMVVALAVAASALLLQASVDHLPGLGAWIVGGVWAWFGRQGWLRPVRLAVSGGAAMAIVGAMATAGSDAGTVLTLVTVVAVVGAAVARRDLLLLGVGTVGLLVNLPAAITRWFPDSMAAPYVLLLIGAGLVVVAVWVARHQGPDEGR